MKQTPQVIESGMRDGLQVGAQLAVCVKGELVADLAFGASRAGAPMTSDSMMVWFSSTKATTAVATAQQWERGAFDLDAPIREKTFFRDGAA